MRKMCWGDSGDEIHAVVDNGICDVDMFGCCYAFSIFTIGTYTCSVVNESRNGMCVVFQHAVYIDW